MTFLRNLRSKRTPSTIRVNSHRITSLAAVLLLAAWAQPALSQQVDFTAEHFDSLNAAGALVLVDVFADWCPTCATQQEVLAEYLEAHPDVPLHILKIDFDRQKNYVTAFRAPRQSTLILYGGGEQLWFSVAEMRREVIFEQLNRAAEAL